VIEKLAISMQTSSEKEFVKYCVSLCQTSKKTIGFVPTMGALHEGHLELVRQAKKENDFVVVSIFVNPLQFNNANDLLKYPRDLQADQDLLEKEYVDLIYAPASAEFYKTEPNIQIEFGGLSKVLEGEMRPGHFSGVAIVVARLFHIVEPTKAYFGAKDLQQVAVIKKLILDLDFDLELVRCPTLRETSGLAMSSRNKRLSDAGKDVAARLYEGLQMGLKAANHCSLEETKTLTMHFLSSFPEIKLEYLEWVDADSFEVLPEKRKEKTPALCIAAWVEGVRLIDNLIWEA
jgi:pantoate--beta-alanine ligase